MEVRGGDATAAAVTADAADTADTADADADDDPAAAAASGDVFFVAGPIADTYLSYFLSPSFLCRNSKTLTPVM